MKRQPTNLFNFRIPTHTKERLKEVCKSRNVSISSILNELIHEYLAKAEATNLDEDKDWVPMIYQQDAESDW